MTDVERIVLPDDELAHLRKLLAENPAWELSHITSVALLNTITEAHGKIAVLTEHLHAVCVAIEDRVQAPITETFFDVLGPARNAIADLPTAARSLLERLRLIESERATWAGTCAAYRGRAEAAEARVAELTGVNASGNPVWTQKQLDEADAEAKAISAVFEINKLKARIAALEKSQRTAGTVEVEQIDEAPHDYSDIDNAESLKAILRIRDRQVTYLRTQWLRDCEDALNGKPQALRTRVELAKAGPLRIIQSALLIPSGEGESV